MSASPSPASTLDAVLLAERLAIVDEIHNDVAHALAAAAIHLGLLDPQGRGRAAGAPGVAQAACQRALDGVRRARTMAHADAGPDGDPESVTSDLAHLHGLGAGCGATVVVEAPLPPAAAMPPGTLVTVARVAEAFLRVTAHHDALVRVSPSGRRVRVAATSDLPEDRWAGADPDLERIRERLRWFDGRLDVTSHGPGSRAVAELAC